MNSNKKKRGSKVGKTLLLDVETMEALKEYGRENLGSESMSAAVRAMAREWKRKQQTDGKTADTF